VFAATFILDRDCLRRRQKSPKREPLKIAVVALLAIQHFSTLKR
jgi:hypothetical protein